MRGESVTHNDTMQQQRLNRLNRSPIRSNKRRSPNHRTIEDYRTNQGVEKGQLGRNILKMMPEALSLQQSQGAHTFTDSGLNNRPQTEMWS